MPDMYAAGRLVVDWVSLGLHDKAPDREAVADARPSSGLVSSSGSSISSSISSSM